MDIYVDSRRCGEGKTYDNSPTAVYRQGFSLSTWGRIKARFELADKTLVVLPSLSLCEKYYQELVPFVQERTVQDIDRKIKRLTSEYTENVQRELHHAFEDGVDIIIITQAAWLQSDIPTAYRSQRHLIIDEAIMPYREIPVYHEETCGIDFNWAKNTNLVEATDMAVEWPELRFYNLKGNFITDAAEQTRFLLNPNWRNRCHMLDYEKFADVMPKNDRLSIIQELLPTIMMNWASIWIACAAFEYTFMGHWMKSHGIDWRIVPGLEFKPHDIGVNIHGPEDKFTWSSYKQSNEPELITQYRDQVTKIAEQDGVLILRNNSQNRQVFAHEQKLPHNSAGSNDYRSYRYVSLESALNATPNMTRFLRDVYGIERESGKDPVHIAQTVYTFYQTLMRSCLRDGKEATVFCLDNRVVLGLAEFFTNINYEEIRLVRKEDIKDPGRPARNGYALTATERSFLSRKRRDPKYLGWTDQMILDLRKK